MLKRRSPAGALDSFTAPVVTAEEAAEFAVDGLSPARIARPGSYEEVAALLHDANVNSLAVIPRGGGSMMHIGNPPRRYDIALDLSGLNVLIEHEPADLTVTPSVA